MANDRGDRLDPTVLQGGSGEPPLRREDIAARLGLAPRAIDTLSYAGYLVGAYVDDTARYPVWGLDLPPAAKERTASLLTMFGQHRRPEWIIFLRHPRTELEGRAPIEWLRAERPLDAVMDVARAVLGETASPPGWDPEAVCPPELSPRALLGLPPREEAGAVGDIARPLPENSLDAWVARNQPPSDSHWNRAWWEAIEASRALTEKWEVDPADALVAGEYVTATPPPVEGLRLPAVCWSVDEVAFIAKWTFAAYRSEWTVSVEREHPYEGSLHGLFDPRRDLRLEGVSGFGPAHTHPPFAQSPACFTCLLDDIWEVSALIRLMTMP